MTYSHWRILKNKWTINRDTSRKCEMENDSQTKVFVSFIWSDYIFQTKVYNVGKLRGKYAKIFAWKEREGVLKRSAPKKVQREAW